MLRKADVVVIGPGLGGSTNYRINSEEEMRQQQQQQKHLGKPGSRGKLSHMLKDAMEDVQKAVLGSSSASSSDKAAASSSTDPLGIDSAATRQAIREAEAGAAVTQRAALTLLRLAMLMRKPIVRDIPPSIAANAPLPTAIRGDCFN